MTYEEALKLLRGSATPEEMAQKIELQSRAALTELIEKGYFDPLLEQIGVAMHQRRANLGDAAEIVSRNWPRRLA